METSKTIQYLATVETPKDKAGNVGDVVPRPGPVADWLIANGYAELADGPGGGSIAADPTPDVIKPADV